MTTQRTGPVKRVVFAGIAVILAVALIEGLASLLIGAATVRRPSRGARVRERDHTQHDELLGWAHRPGLRIDGIYGPETWLQTSSQGFRSVEELPAEAPEGVTRIICSGDSFTLGFGVSNDATWPARLAAIAPGIETVNMGQGGYGIGQAFLWYRRDGMPLDHQIHVLAFVTLDFERTQSPDYHGYPKPVVRLRDDELVVDNVPVPLYDGGPLRWRQGFESLALSRLWKRPRPARDGDHRLSGTSESVLQSTAYPVVLRMIEELREMHAERGTHLVVVHIPVLSDYRRDAVAELRRELHTECESRDALFVDAIGTFRELPSYAAAEELFRRHDVHYSERGNAWVAGVIHAALVDEGLLPPSDQ